MATKREKSAVPRAANVGTATARARIAAAAMRAKLLLRISDSPLGFSLETVSEVQADQVCVGAVNAVDAVRIRGARAAALEVQHELGGVDGPRSLVIADAEGDALAVGVRQHRAHRGRGPGGLGVTA